jgi:hypothetical protein
MKLWREVASRTASVLMASTNWVRGMRRLWKLIIFVFAVYGPLGPTVILFLLAAPPLILLSGWPVWIQAALFTIDVVSVLGAAIVLGPSAVAEIRAEFEAERRS